MLNVITYKQMKVNHIIKCVTFMGVTVTLYKVINVLDTMEKIRGETFTRSK